jgi:glycolate oxidase FAD binding subunit
VLSLDESSCSIDAIGLSQVVRPASIAELCDVVRRAAAEEQGVFPLGGRTMLGQGLPPSRPGIGIDLNGLNEVIDYPARDMTITVQSGITLARLQEILRSERQRLPVDVPAAERATLGGALATNTSGPRRHGFGTFRDYVIGISTINDQGQETKAGGRVVKNVAGYDLCKLHIGALGTLGIISQVTLKLRPLPEESALVICRCNGTDLDAILSLVHESRTRPVCVDVLNPSAAARLPGNEGSWLVIVGFEECTETVHWQVEQLVKVLSSKVQGIDALVRAAAEPLRSFLCEFRLDSTAILTFKANMLPHAVPGFCNKAAQRSESIRLQAHAGNGIVIAHIAGDLTLERAAAMLKELRHEAVKAQGNLVILNCPSDWKATLPVWGEPRGDAALMKAVRNKLDPRRLFNPGRFC